MNTHRSSAEGDSASSNGSVASADAITLLREDHADIAEMFEDYEALVEEEGDEEERQALAERICAMLTVHATIEEEIFYPAAREVLDRLSLLDEAEVEHAMARELIEQIQSIDPDDELYDAKVKVLGEYVRHHVEEEEREIFPKCHGADLDLETLGEDLDARRDELLEEYGLLED